MHNNLNDQKRDKAKGIKEKYALFSKYPIHEYIVRKGAKNLSSLKAIIDVERNSLNVKDENDNTPLMLLVETQWLEGLELVFTELKNNLFKFDMLQYSRIMTSLHTHGNFKVTACFLKNTNQYLTYKGPYDSKTIYESIFCNNTLSKVLKLQLVKLYLDYRFDVPPTIVNGRTLSQYITNYFMNIFKTNKSTKLNFISLMESIFKVIFDISVEKQEVELETLLVCENNDNVIHYCIYLNIPEVMEYILTLVKSFNEELLNKVITTPSVHGSPPLYLCCDAEEHSERNEGKNWSRVECAKILLKHGVNINQTILEDKFSVLHYLVGNDMDHLPTQRQMLVFLIENGANIFLRENPETDAPIRYFFWYLQTEAIFKIIEMKLINTDLILGTRYNAISSLLSSFLNFASDDSLSLAKQEHCLRDFKAILHKLLLEGFKFKVTDLIHLIFFHNNKEGNRYVLHMLKYIKYMAQLKAFPLGRLITVATVRNSTKLVLGLIKNGVVDSKPIELKLCENNPPHRYLHYQNIQEKYIALGYDFTAEYLYCDICGKKFNVDDTVCASIKCDFDFCGSCAFFSVDREGATALKISKLVNNVALININNYLENMKDLKKFTNTISFQKNFEEFRNAKIDIGIPAAKLNNLCYQKLGIIINFILL